MICQDLIEWRGQRPDGKIARLFDRIDKVSFAEQPRVAQRQIRCIERYLGRVLERWGAHLRHQCEPSADGAFFHAETPWPKKPTLAAVIFRKSKAGRSSRRFLFWHGCASLWIALGMSCSRACKEDSDVLLFERGSNRMLDSEYKHARPNRSCRGGIAALATAEVAGSSPKQARPGCAEERRQGGLVAPPG